MSQTWNPADRFIDWLRSEDFLHDQMFLTADSREDIERCTDDFDGGDYEHFSDGPTYHEAEDNDFG